MNAPSVDCHVCFHGHFYQPSREDPWTGVIPQEPTAAPYHDWNMRIATECYLPNLLLGNFTHMSFDVGPPLMGWFRQSCPVVYQGLVSADQGSALAQGGHGNAIAHPEVHAILPLAPRRDKVTLVRWGLESFRFHFGRTAEGLWLPETAVDRETLEVLAELGIRFVILAPSQARRIRLSGQAWETVHDGHFDTSRAYRCDLADGKAMDILFYHQPVSLAVSFGDALSSDHALSHRVLEAFDESGTWPQLVLVATDGETYGHHRPGGERALAATAQTLRHTHATVTNVAAYLADHPSGASVEIHEGSSWSCSHGIERWRSGCGCRLGGGPGWQQQWRAPLREALNRLAEALDEVFEHQAGALLRDPWAARDGSITLRLRGWSMAEDGFLAEHALKRLRQADRHRVWSLLEMERCRLNMFASDGWFFDEVSGLETAQILKYASRAVRLAEFLTGGEIMSHFVADLRRAKSNLDEFRDGEGVWKRLVEPTLPVLV